MKELKPCPFCGKSNIRFTPRNVNDNELGYHYCSDCWARTGSEVQTYEQSIKSWNTRASTEGER